MNFTSLISKRQISAFLVFMSFGATVSEPPAYATETQSVPYSGRDPWDYSSINEAHERVCQYSPSEYSFDSDAQSLSIKNAYWLSAFSKQAYSSPFQAKMYLWQKGIRKFEFFNSGSVGLQAFVAADSANIFVVFRGSEQIKDWLINLDFAIKRVSPKDIDGKIHRGFERQLNSKWPEIVNRIQKFRNHNQKIWITGHSLGAALGSIAAFRLASMNIPVAGLYTFGSPRVGNLDFAKRLNVFSRNKTFRFVNNVDIVARIPPSAETSDEFADLFPPFLNESVFSIFKTFQYSHVGNGILLDKNRVLWPMPDNDAAPEEHYWESVKTNLTGRDLGKWITENSKLAQDHSPSDYECNMAEVFSREADF